jgi:hypothetical protein
VNKANLSVGENKFIKSKRIRRRTASKRLKYSRTSDCAGDQFVKLVEILGRLDDFVRPSPVAIDHRSPRAETIDYLDGGICMAKNAPLHPPHRDGSAAA